MEHARRAQRLGLAALLATLAALAACAPFGVQAPLPVSRAEIATTTAAAAATYGAGTTNTTPVANLPRLSVDPGWVAVEQVPDGSKLGGTEVVGGAPGSGGIASVTLTLGSFKLSSAALVRSVFACASPANVHAALEISVDGSSSKIQCTPTGASTIDQYGLTSADAGRTLTVTATISTNSTSPQWNALVEQPK
jgi:hypothetical protein